MNRSVLFERSRYWCLLAGAVLIVVGSAMSATADPGLPVPASRQPADGFRRQQIRYRTSALMQNAHDQIGAGDDEAARETLDTVIGNDPANNRARLMLVQVLLRLGHEDRALELMDEMIATYPEAAGLYRERAYMHIRATRREAARQDLERFLATAPAGDHHLPTARESLAQTLFELGHYAEAAGRMRERVAEADGYARRRFLAECAIKLEQWDVAVRELERARDLATRDADRADTHLSLGYVRYNSGDFREADRDLEAAVALADDPFRMDEILRLRGMAAYRDGRYEAADGFLAQVLESGYDETVAATRLDALQFAGAYAAAIRVAHAHLAEDPVSEAFRHGLLERLMNLHIAQRDYPRALAAANALFEASGRDEVLLTAAIAAEQADRLDTAIALYEDYLQRVFDANATLGMQYVILQRGNEFRQAGRPEAELQALLDIGIPYLVRVILDEDTPAILRMGARYELAQVKRERDEPEAYFALMESVIDLMPEGRFLFEYAVQLYGRGHAELALPVFEQAYEKLDDPEARFIICRALAEIQLGRDAPDEAIAWLDRATAHGSPDARWTLLRAQADYQMGNYRATIDRLRPVADQDDAFNILIGFAFNNMEPPMPGLALAHMNRVGAPEALDPDARFTFLSNRAYLHYDQHMDAEAIADAEAALAVRQSDEMELVRLRSMLRAGQYANVQAAGSALRARMDGAAASAAEGSDAPASIAFLGQVYETMGIAAYNREAWDRAVAHFTQALEQDESLLESRYMRGLAHFRSDRLDEAREDLLPLSEHPEAFPKTFHGDLAFVLGQLEEFDAGIDWLDQSLAVFPYDIDGWQERGYQSMKAHRNPDALEAFARAMDLYDEILPYTEPREEADLYLATRMSLTQEYSKLDKTWSFQIYGERTDFDIEANLLPRGVPGESTQGALQSQGGIGIGYRPPRIGFRDEKILDISLRVLANFHPGTWEPDRDSYQGGLGIQYKPFRRHNYGFGFERLFKIGDNAEDNWLWRNTYGLEGGERPLRGRRVWLWWRGYGEASYYLEDPKRWVFFGQGNAGPSVFLANRLMLTFPEAVGVARYQTNDPTGIGTYWYYGPGVQLRLLDSKELNARARDRWALTAYARYVWGRFERLSRNIVFDDEDFEGWILGINLTR